MLSRQALRLCLQQILESVSSERLANIRWGMPPTRTFPTISDLKKGTTIATAELHISGGVRASLAANRLWSVKPVFIAGELKALAPMSLNHVASFAQSIGGALIGYDEISGMGSPLPTRVWVPLDDPNPSTMQPADLWQAIAAQAWKAGDDEYQAFASHISLSLRAAGIRLRDASDHYTAQLLAAISAKREAGARFSNMPLSDIHIAFHSVLSELASARDYLAAAIAFRLGAPKKYDALNRVREWLAVASRADERSDPIIAHILKASDPASADPWLYHLTEYRNRFLHKRPMGASDEAVRIRYDHKTHASINVPIIEVPLGGDDPFRPGQDALLCFVQLYRKMNSLMAQAAAASPYPSVPPQFESSIS